MQTKEKLIAYSNATGADVKEELRELQAIIASPYTAPAVLVPG